MHAAAPLSLSLSLQLESKVCPSVAAAPLVTRPGLARKAQPGCEPQPAILRTARERSPVKAQT